MWGINLQNAVFGAGFVFSGLGGVIEERVLTCRGVRQFWFSP
jgi:hypothetical protein